MRYDEEWDSFIEELLAENDHWEEQLEQADLRQLRQEMADYQAKFESLGEKYHLPLVNRILLVQELSLAVSKGTEQAELAWLYGAILTDKGLLLDQNREGRTEEQDLLCYLKAKAEQQVLIQELNRRKALSIQFRNQLAKIKKLKLFAKGEMSEIKKHQLAQIFWEYYPDSQGEMGVLDNLEYLWKILQTAPELESLAPLWLFQIMTKHRNYLATTTHLELDWNKLWEPNIYQIGTDNGKNYRDFANKLVLYLGLSEYFINGQLAVNQDLCAYGFAYLSNLTDWYYKNTEAEEESLLLKPWPEIIVAQYFSCFENSDFISSLAGEELEINNPRYEHLIQGIEVYLAQNAAAVESDFIKAWLSPETKVKLELIIQIFDQAPVSKKHLSPEDLPQIYAMIASLLLDLIEQQAEIRLIEIAKKLAGE